MYQHGLKIKEALTEIAENKYVLPAIQREFVWSHKQICNFWDSIMAGYPFGVFLFWKVNEERSADFKFYGFMRNYHELDAPYCPELATIHSRAVTAVLDGQQRMTALNIGLNGSLAVREPKKWRTNPDAYPKKVLYLDLFAEPTDEDDGYKYRFEFKDPDKVSSSATELWFRVSDILEMESSFDTSTWLLCGLDLLVIAGRRRR